MTFSYTKKSFAHSLPILPFVCYQVSEGARLHFIKFETKHISSCLEYIGKSLKSRMVGQDIKVWLWDDFHRVKFGKYPKLLGHRWRGL